MKRFLGTVKAGSLVVYNQTGYFGELMRMEGKEIQIDVGLKTNPRTIKQNSYYWGVIIRMIEEETGQDKQDIHEFMKALFLKRYVTIGKFGSNTTGSTAKLNTQPFIEYNNKIKQWSAENLSIVIPDLENEMSSRLIDEWKKL